MSNRLELQNYLLGLKEQVRFKQAIDRLYMNEDFKEVILKGFCEDEMKRTLGLSVAENINPQTRELCNQLAKSSAALHNYLDLHTRYGLMAEEEIPNVEEQLASPELDQEEDN